MKPLFPLVLFLALVAAPSALRTEPGPVAPNVVLFFIDTLRADHVHCYGARRETTPNLDLMAARGTLFEHAFSQASWSLPSYTTVFSSLYPPVHGVTTTLRSVAPETELLSEIFARHGYGSAAFVAGGHLAPAFGLSRGFDLYQSTSYGASLSYTVPPALQWLDSHGARPFFLMVHGYDVHCPYSPPLGFSELYDPDYQGVVHHPGFLLPEVLEKIQDLTYSSGALASFRASYAQAPGQSWRRRMLLPPLRPELGELETDEPDWPSAVGQPGQVGAQPVPVGPGGLPFKLPDFRETLTPADVEHLRAHYDGGVTYADTWLGMFLEGLERRGLRDKTIVIVAGDHGEELGEHGRFGHGHSLWDCLVRVPFVMAGPGVAEGRRIRQTAELADVAPTLLELCSIPASHKHQGRSLAKLLKPGPPPTEDLERPGFAFEMRASSIHLGRWHLIVSRVSEHSDELSERLYDLSVDPTEQKDVHLDNPEIVRKLKSRLQDCAEELSLRSQKAGTAVLGDDEKRFLQRFGYW
jgi:arylsulfatase A-like enzyme